MIGAILQIAGMAAKDIGGGIFGGVLAKGRREAAVEAAGEDTQRIAEEREQAKKDFDVFEQESRRGLARDMTIAKEGARDVEKGIEESRDMLREERQDFVSDTVFGESDAIRREEQMALKKRRIGG